MPVNPTQFEQHLARGPLACVYLIAGSEDLLRIEAADAVRKRARELGFSEREVFDVESGFDWNAVAASFVALSLFATRRLIELRLPTGKPAKEGSAVIGSYCKSPPPDICLLITAHEWSRAHESAWVTAVDKRGIALTLWPMRPNELPAWIARRLKSRGVVADGAAVAQLAERVEGNLLAAAQEIDKLVLLAEGRTIDAARMAELVADSARFDVFGLADAALSQDSARALRMLRSLKGEGESPVALLSWLAGQIQVLAHLAEVRTRGGDLGSAMQRWRVFESRQPAFKKALRHLRGGDIALLLRQCAVIERVGKGRAIGDAWLELERLLLGMAKPQVLAADG